MGQPPVNVRGVGERHNIVKQTVFGFGGRCLRKSSGGGGPLRPDPAFVFCQAPSLMTFATGGIPHDGSRHKWEGLDGQEGFLQALKCEPCLEE